MGICIGVRTNKLHKAIFYAAYKSTLSHTAHAPGNCENWEDEFLTAEIGAIYCTLEQLVKHLPPGIKLSEKEVLKICREIESDPNIKMCDISPPLEACDDESKVICVSFPWIHFGNDETRKLLEKFKNER